MNTHPFLQPRPTHGQHCFDLTNFERRVKRDELYLRISDEEIQTDDKREEARRVP